MFPPEIRPIIDELLPICKSLAEDRYAVSIGGSFGKGTFDKHSDIDFRLFCDRVLQPPDERAAAQENLRAAIHRWGSRGYTIDGCWIRTIEQVSQQLDRCMDGLAERTDLVWTIWGYQLLPDIYHQAVIDDPFGVIAHWKAQLAHYPPKLKRAIMEQHLASVRYWRADYHYHNKVRRKDVVFLAGLTVKIVHDLIRILFALNETYYVGDGNNLDFIAKFEHVPDGFEAQVERILYPQLGDGALGAQRGALIDLIDQVEALVDRLGAVG